ncbi:hypothetical protein [Shewanella sp. WPAGA9]|uniref:hypothetical protein n=1 Tax=Shewanella sp. ENK2 TaxID=2775245 RepID=UPI001785362D|nr:hypothetical protein [Shewanella sp. WPAGA9]
MLHTMQSSIQPLSSYNPFTLRTDTNKIADNNSQNNQAVSNQQSTVDRLTRSRQVSEVNHTSAAKQETLTKAAEPTNAHVAFVEQSDINDAVDAKLQYDKQTHFNASQQQHVQGSEGAIKEYLLNQHAAQREQIQQMVGIDLYA